MKRVALLLAGAIALAGCNDESPKTDGVSTTGAPQETTEEPTPKSTVVVSELGSSYAKVCDLLEDVDPPEVEKCRSNKGYRAALANDMAAKAATEVVQRAEGFNAAVMEEKLQGDVLNLASETTIDEMPTHLIGVPNEEVDMPKYYKILGAVFAYTTEVSTSAIVINDGFEIALQVDQLSRDQQDFLESVCFPEMNHEYATCRGEIYAALVPGDKTVHMSMIGAKLESLDVMTLTEVELKKLW